MIRKYLLLLGLITIFKTGQAQNGPQQPKDNTLENKAVQWSDSIFNSLTPEERIAQLIMIRAHSNLGQDHINKVVADIRDNKVGGVIFFQGGPVRQAQLTNYYQSISKVPLMVGIDGEWGLGMRLDSVISLPRNLMIGAIRDSSLAYDAGRLIGNQC